MPRTKMELSIREAARVLGVATTHVYSLVWASLLKAERRDGRWYLSEADVLNRKERLQKLRENRKRQKDSEPIPLVGG